MAILYHGTTADNYETIKTEGLIPAKGAGADAWARKHHWKVAEAKRTPSVYLSTAKGWATEFAHFAMEVDRSNPMVLTIDVPDEHMAELHDDEASKSNREKNFRAERPIPPEWIVSAEEVSRDLSFGEIIQRVLR